MSGSMFGRRRESYSHITDRPRIGTHISRYERAQTIVFFDLAQVEAIRMSTTSRFMNIGYAHLSAGISQLLPPQLKATVGAELHGNM